MKVQKRHLRIALFVLSAAALFSVVSYLRPVRRTTSPQPPPLIAAPGDPASAMQIDPLSIRAPHDVDMARAPGFSRDPFLFGDETREIVKPVTVPDGASAPAVRSILFSSTRRLAVVNGKIVGVGDQVGTYKVAEIEQGAVVFTLPDGQRQRVSVHGAVPAGLRR